ncbi:Nn.00g041340.m01.CDS01 [Neocucurbitaria sp. VM-36]
MASLEIHRHIEGGNVKFLAGCALSGFDLNPSIRITNKLSIKSDANTILVSWRPSSEMGPLVMKAVLQSVAGPLRFCHKPPPIMRGRWHANTIAGFYQPEHARAALKHFSGSTGVEVRLVYTVYFTAPKELSDVVLLDVEDIAAQIPEARIVWEEPRAGMVTLRLSGTSREDIVDMKRIFEAIYAGRIATRRLQGARYEIWHDFFATPPGEIWLQHLARDTGIIIMSDKLQRRLRVYDPEGDNVHMDYAEWELAEKVTELDAWHESHTITLNVKDFRRLMASGAVARAQKKLGKANVSLDVLQKALVLRCDRPTANLVTDELSLPSAPPDLTRAQLNCPQCNDTTTDIEFSICGHVACRDCFDHQLKVASSDLTGNHFPLVCWHEDCEQPVSILDLRKYATGNMVDALLKASLTYHIRSLPEVYRNCRTPDCRSVYLRNGSYEIFTCPNCLTQTCTLCHAEPHIGWTCTEYDAHLRKTQVNEHLLDNYKAQAGTKECPKCSTLIEKVDGCNHVECSGCHGHICWVCLKVFASSDAAYQHMNDVHGGNGLVDEEGEDEDSELDSEEEDDDDDDMWEDTEDEYEYDIEHQVPRWHW